jgi:hypothetical protein
MEITEFDALFQEVRARRAGMERLPEVRLFDLWRVTEEDLARAEEALGAVLPGKYKDFMLRYGGGQFLFLDLMPIVSPDVRVETLLDANRRETPGQEFIVVAPVGTGDWWGFVPKGGVCEEQVGFLDHEDGSIQRVALDFLEFVARRGLMVGEKPW